MGSEPTGSALKPTPIALTHFQAELLITEQCTLFIQLGKQQTGLFPAGGLQEPIVCMIGCDLLGMRSQSCRPGNAHPNQRRRKRRKDQRCMNKP